MATKAASPFAYVRVKLLRTTVFIVADLGAGGYTGRALRLEAGRLLGVSADMDSLRLLRRDDGRGDGFVVVEEEKTLSAQNVRNDDVLMAVQRDADGRWAEPCLDALHS